METLPIVRKEEFQYIPQYSLNEFVLPVVVGIFVFAIGSVPYIYGYSIANEERVFTGLVGKGTAGTNGYLMFLRQTIEGEKWHRNQCTPEKINKPYINIEWWILGRIARVLNLSPIQFFHLDRFFAVLLFALSLYFLLVATLSSVLQRIFCFFLIVFGSGFGWVLWMLNHYLDINLPLSWDVEGTQIFGYLVNKPHFIRGFGLAILMYSMLIRGFQTGKPGYFLVGGIVALLHSFMRPFLIPESYAVCFLFPLFYCWRLRNWESKWFVLSSLPAIISLPGVLYYVWLTITDPLGMKGWSEYHQFLGKPGFLIEYVFGVGWTFLLLIPFFFYIVKRCVEKVSYLIIFTWLMIAWLVCNLYPYWKVGQESGLYAFLVVPPILTVIGPYKWLLDMLNSLRWRGVDFLKTRGLILLASILILGSLPSSAYVYTNMFTSLKYGHPLWTYYMSRGTFNALNWLKAKASRDAVVIASFRTSQFIFANTNCKSVTGHFMLTREFVKKDEEVKRFYVEADNIDFQRYLIRKYNIEYILARTV